MAAIRTVRQRGCTFAIAMVLGPASAYATPYTISDLVVFTTTGTDLSVRVDPSDPNNLRRRGMTAQEFRDTFGRDACLTAAGVRQGILLCYGVGELVNATGTEFLDLRGVRPVSETSPTLPGPELADTNNLPRVPGAPFNTTFFVRLTEPGAQDVLSDQLTMTFDRQEAREQARFFFWSDPADESLFRITPRPRDLPETPGLFMDVAFDLFGPNGTNSDPRPYEVWIMSDCGSPALVGQADEACVTDVLDFPDVPEPSTLILLSTGFVGFVTRSWRQRKRVR